MKALADARAREVQELRSEAHNLRAALRFAQEAAAGLQQKVRLHSAFGCPPEKKSTLIVHFGGSLLWSSILEGISHESDKWLEWFQVLSLLASTSSVWTLLSKVDGWYFAKVGQWWSTFEGSELQSRI